MKLCEISRGEGRIFIRISYDNLPEVCTYKAISTTESGQTIPAMVIPRPKHKDFVFVVPVLTITQKITLTVFDQQNTPIAKVQRVIRPRFAQFTSQVNTFTKNQMAEEIRNLDIKLRQSKVSLKLDGVFPRGKDGQSTHVKATFCQDNSDTTYATSAQSKGYSFHAMFMDGEPIAQNQIINLGENNQKDYPYLGYTTHVLNLALITPINHKGIICWIEDGSSQEVWAISCLMPYEIDNRREGWKNETSPIKINGQYPVWNLTKHTTAAYKLQIQRSMTFKNQPLFSFVVPLYKTPLDFFHEMVDSVLAQTYPYFELILVNASPELESLAHEVEKLCAQDSRVKNITLEENKGITLNTNEGIKIAQGDFLCFLDHDDTIEPDLLFEYAKAINQNPTTDLIYCDEDKFKEGAYYDPSFKPEWNLALELSQNYVCHLLCVRKSIVDEIGLPSNEVDGSQDHHMTLRVAEKARHIHHVAKVLYHWRIHAGSVASGEQQKSYTTSAGIEAITQYLKRNNISAHVEPHKSWLNKYNLIFDLKKEPLVSILIPNKDSVDLLRRCIASIINKSTYTNYEIIVIENNSTQEATFECYRQLEATYPQVKVTYETDAHGFNFSKTINFGRRSAQGEYLLLLNNDTEIITPHWIEQLVGYAMLPDVGAVGAQLFYPDDLIQHAGVAFCSAGPFHEGHFFTTVSDAANYYNIDITRETSAVTGACLLTKASLFDELKGLDEIAFKEDYNDIDYCLRVREKGFRVIYQATCKLYHYESVSRYVASESFWRNEKFCTEMAQLMQRWACYYVNGDPFVSKYLSPAQIIPHYQINLNIE